MMRRLLPLLPLLFLAAPALAEPILAEGVACGDRDKLLARLGKDYSEQPVATGVAKDGSRFEILASATGSFTVLLTRPNGLTCLVAEGQNWQSIQRAVGDISA